MYGQRMGACVRRSTHQRRLGCSYDCCLTTGSPPMDAFLATSNSVGLGAGSDLHKRHPGERVWRSSPIWRADLNGMPPHLTASLSMRATTVVRRRLTTASESSAGEASRGGSERQSDVFTPAASSASSTSQASARHSDLASSPASSAFTITEQQGREHSARNRAEESSSISSSSRHATTVRGVNAIARSTRCAPAALIPGVHT
jgi:hypothetical protein